MKAQETHLLEVLSNNDVTFFIPPYQRNYEWDEEQCSVLFDDIKSVTEANIEGENTEHFFGSIVFVQEDNVWGQPAKLILTDGQQRITTTMLFLVALRDVIADPSKKDFINNKYLKNNNVDGSNEFKIKLKQVETDWEAYKNIILELDLTDENKNSAVYKNYLYFKKQLKKYSNSSKINLTDFVEKGLLKFSIVQIQLYPDTNSWENPQEIFESMNSLGKPLSLADLVRNYLLIGKSAKKQDDLYHNYWLSIEKYLPNETSNFIRDYMQLVAGTDYKKAKESNNKILYAEFKKLFRAYDTEEIIKNLSKFSKYYAMVVLGLDTGNNDVNRKLFDLRNIDVTITYSFLLDLIYRYKEENEFNDKDILDILDALIVYFLRRRILRLTQGENKIFPTLVNRIDELRDSDNKKETMFNILSSYDYSFRLPKDKEVLEELKTMNFYNFKNCKFILSLVEEKLTKQRPDLNLKVLQIEHIMPQTLNHVWKQALGDNFLDIHSLYLNTIGNLTLITWNQELGNKPFDEKKDIYTNKSGLQIAQTKIIDCDKWDEKTIINRCEWITNYIIENVIPLPEERKQKDNFSLTERYSNRLSFEKLGLIGETINYISDPSITAYVVGDREIRFEGEIMKLSPATNLIETRKGTCTKSGSYQGSNYWEYQGTKLSDMQYSSSDNPHSNADETINYNQE